MGLGRDILRGAHHSGDTRIVDYFEMLGPDNYIMEHDDALMEFIRTLLIPKKTELISCAPVFEIPKDTPTYNLTEYIMGKEEYCGTSYSHNVDEYLQIFLMGILSHGFTPRIFDYTHVIINANDTTVLVLKCPHESANLTSSPDESYALTFDLALLRRYLVNRETIKIHLRLEEDNDDNGLTKTIIVAGVHILVASVVFIALRLLF
jgi:hypothetical protein